MISLFGNIVLGLALLCALLQGTLPLWGYVRNNPYALSVARPSCIGQFIFVLAAYLLLTIAFVTNDFTLAYVAANSHASLPFMYRLTAVWGAHEGSILFWVLVLNIWSMFYIAFAKREDNFNLTLAILGLIGFCFLCFILLTSNPFLSLNYFASGNDLNPLLQDPGFVIHPPMLYIGYVGFSVAFAMTLAALINNQLNARWAYLTKQFAIAAWCFLTFGITLGSWWAYRVLGWGGFWFWDPVENASLLPWLSGIALIHVLILCEKRDAAKSWAALLAIITFALSVLGTFLVRSGVLISAHTFANDPARGVFLLLLLGFLASAALVIYIIRLPQVTSKPLHFSFFSREYSLLINSALIFVAMLTILVGTLYPLIVDALHLGTISVGAPYFNTVMMPLVFITMAAMGIGALCRWRGQSITEFWKLHWKKAFLSIVLATCFIWAFTDHFNAIAITSLALSLWIIASIFSNVRTSAGMAVAHCGFAILIIGIILSSVLSQEREVRMRIGNATDIGPYQFFFISTEGVSGSNYRGIQADFEVLKNTRHITNLYPEKRIYLVRDMVMTKVDIHPSIFRDLYIALGEPLNNDVWSVRIYYKPFIRWIWFGGCLMMLGGIITILTRRRGE